MPKYEISVRSDYGSIGPFVVNEAGPAEAWLTGAQVAHAFLAEGLSPAFLDRTWVVVARSETGEVSTSVPFRFTDGERREAKPETPGQNIVAKTRQAKGDGSS